MRRVDHVVQQLVERGVDVDQVHAGGSHHHVTGRHVGHPDHALQHDTRVGTDHIVVFGLGQGFDQLVGRVRARVDELGHFLQEGALVFFFRMTRRVRV